MERQLVVLEGKEKGKVYALPVMGTFTIGRGTTTDTKLTDLRVSRVHCTLELEAGRARVVDAQSATGTFVNNQRLPGETVLRAGDVVKIGDTEMRFESDEDVAEAATIAGVLPSEAVTIGNELLASARGPAAAVGTRADPHQALVGITLAHYTITKLVAVGRSSVVYRAQDNQEDRAVALKILKEEAGKNAGEMQTLGRTLQNVLPLRHTNLVALYDVGRDNGRCWFATEFVNGENLGAVMERAGVAGMVDWQHVLRWALHIARGLEFLHQHGFIHGGITPHAVLVGTSDKVARLGRLSDARPLEDARAKSRARPLESLGEVAYRAPEQVRGDLYGDVRSDIYCLGATLYALLTGRPPFEGATPVDALTKVLQPDVLPPRPREFQLVLPESFEQVVMRMLAKKPDERYASVTEVIADVERIIGGQSTATPTVAPGAASTAREGTIAITCGNCGQKLRPWKKFVGTQVRCPSCTKLLVVPDEPGVVQPLENASFAAASTLIPPLPSPLEPKPFSNAVVMTVAGLILAFGLGLAAFMTLGNAAPPTSTAPATHSSAAP